MERQVMVVEDDPVSAEFLRSALMRIGEVRILSAASALREALNGPPPALLLLDDRLGNERADGVLDLLRANWGAALPVLLISAELPAELAAQRLRQGADACLLKPMTVAALWEAVGSIAPQLLPDWDDEAADRALGGDPANRNALRRLLLGDLPQLRSQVVAAVEREDRPALADLLHRLRAACGFCGATALAAAAAALGREPGPRALQAFESACASLLDAASLD